MNQNKTQLILKKNHVKKNMQISPLKEYEQYSNRKLNQKFLEACAEGKFKFIQSILSDINLKHKIDLNSQDASNENSLDNACFSGNLNLVKFLIEYESNLSNNKLPSKLNNALMMAGEFEHFHIVKYILENPILSTYIDPSYENHEFINTVCNNESKLILDYLLNSNTSLVKYKVNNIKDGISYASDNNNYDIISCILAKSKNKDKIFELIFEARNNRDMLEYVICNYGIEKTPFIENLVKHNEQIMKMFSKQDLNKELQKMSINATKPVKKNKI
jgi:hypothetical protein